jgi:N-acetylmuramoyl-L-alanine amidase
MKKTVLIFALLLTQPAHAWWPFGGAQKPFVLMIEAAGNPRQPGRTIEDNFEQSIAWSFAQQLRQTLMQQLPAIQVVLNRNEREVIEPLHTANFANKLAADLVISLNVYQETAIKPHVYLYQFSYGSEPISNTAQTFLFCPYDQAYMISSKKSDAYAQLLKNILKKEEYAPQFECLGIYKIPFAPLIGITCPAFALEIGLKNKQEWQLYLEPLAAGIAAIVEQRL